MTKPNDGGPAFAGHAVGPRLTIKQTGMSLRAWLAGQDSESMEIYKWLYGGELHAGEELLLEELAGIKVKLADAVIAELDKETAAKATGGSDGE